MTDLAPGGRPSDPAISWRGRSLSYAEFGELIARSPVGAPVDVSGMPVPDALACAFAAARAGTSVLVRDPDLPAPDLGDLPDGCWLVACTSGSSGRPRAVCRTAASWTASVEPLAELAGLDGRDRLLLTGPVHATLHLHAAVHALAVGAELTDRAERATATHCVPAVLADLLDSLPAGAPLRTAVVAGAALPGRVAERAGERGVAVTEYYGAAELSFVAARRLPDPVLRPFPGVRVRLGPDGVLWARSPYLALGYAGSGGGALRVDGDGFATVGDLAASAPTGAADSGAVAVGLLIRGRGESAIVTGGFTVLAEDVEAALAGIAGVSDVAVIGLPHARLGEVVTAVLELEPGADPDAARSCARARSRATLSGPARPRRYLVLDALPRLGGGKVARAALREALLR